MAANTPDNDSEMWDWQSTGNFLDDNLDMSKCLWSSINQNDISFSFDDEFTPVKACGDLVDYVNIYEDTSKELEKCSEHSSQVKRRRLHFNSDISDAPLCNEEMSSYPSLEKRGKSAKEGSYSYIMSQIDSGYSDCTSSSGNDILDHSSDVWLTSLSDAGTHYSPSDLESHVQIDMTEFCQTQCPPKSVSMKQDHNTVHIRRNVLMKDALKGRQSYIPTPPKVASSIVYPFAFIKPCGVLGDMTLKDINQRIRTPPPKLKQSTDDPCYPTSAFSGKPVVGRTTLSTDGGRGSITIMRTKG